MICFFFYEYIQDHQGMSNIAPTNTLLFHLCITKGESGFMEDSEIVLD